MEADAQGNVCPVVDIPGQDAKFAEHMPMDVFRFCEIFRFLEQLLHSWHTASFLGLFYPVTYKDMEVSFHVKGSIFFDD